MPIEISYLIASVALYFVMILSQSTGAFLAAAAGKVSLGDLVGARDTLPSDGYAPFHSRAKRAQANMTEGMMMFAPLVLAAAHLGAFNAMTALGAALFFWARVAFAPLYWFGVPWVRTLVWFVSIIGIILIFLQILPFSPEVTR
ncbi:MAPEG family protein [Fretibacter rubidus]|uniref:MAPEG family protein n=1 Tax=Fretibacter rubidus TaxID=570162 RepID=UPI00352A18A7